MKRTARHMGKSECSCLSESRKSRSELDQAFCAVGAMEPRERRQFIAVGACPTVSEINEYMSRETAPLFRGAVSRLDMFHLTHREINIIEQLSEFRMIVASLFVPRVKQKIFICRIE